MSPVEFCMTCMSSPYIAISWSPISPLCTMNGLTICPMQLKTVCSKEICSLVFLLPSENEVARRLCFYTHLSFCPCGGLPQFMLGYTPTPPQADTTWQATPWQTATGADGTHPTGMRYCKLCRYVGNLILLTDCRSILVYVIHEFLLMSN